MSRQAEIRLNIELDDDNLPTHIVWQASDAAHDGPRRCQSVMLSLWDSDTKSTAAIDLWTTDTTVDEMNLHFYQVIQKLADTYQRATNNAEVAGQISAFGERFGVQLGLR